MSDDLNDPQLSTSAVRHIDRQCDDFEAAWNSGECPKIFVADVDVFDPQHEGLYLRTEESEFRFLRLRITDRAGQR